MIQTIRKDKDECLFKKKHSESNEILLLKSIKYIKYPPTKYTRIYKNVKYTKNKWIRYI